MSRRTYKTEIDKYINRKLKEGFSMKKIEKLLLHYYDVFVNESFTVKQHLSFNGKDVVDKCIISGKKVYSDEEYHLLDEATRNKINAAGLRAYGSNHRSYTVVISQTSLKHLRKWGFDNL